MTNSQFSGTEEVDETTLTLGAYDTIGRVRGSADISPCGLHRYWLSRSWNRYHNGQPFRGRGIACFVMLNPSKADANLNDPTVRRVIRFCQDWGFDGVTVRNLFSYRATDPKELLTADNPSGGRINDMELLAACTADLVVAAWGASVPFGRDKEVMALWEKAFPAKPIWCLSLTKHRHPRHPLYVAADSGIWPFNEVARQMRSTNHDA